MSGGGSDARPRPCITMSLARERKVCAVCMEPMEPNEGEPPPNGCEQGQRWGGRGSLFRPEGSAASPSPGGAAPLVHTPCMHTFHKACLERWACARWSAPSCPLCRTPLPEQLLPNDGSFPAPGMRPTTGEMGEGALPPRLDPFDDDRTSDDESLDTILEVLARVSPHGHVRHPSSAVHVPLIVDHLARSLENSINLNQDVASQGSEQVRFGQ